MDLIEALSKIVEISHSNIEIDSRLNGILKLIERNINGSEAHIYILDQDNRLTLRYSSRRSPLSILLSPHRPLLGEGIVGSIAQKRETQFFTIQNVPKRLGFLLLGDLDKVILPYRRFAFLPISDESKCYGILMVLSSYGSSFTEAEKRLLKIAAKELMGLIKLAELYTDSSKRITELMTLSEIGKVLISNRDFTSMLRDIALIVAKTLSAEFVHITMKEKNGEKPPRSVTFGEITKDQEEEVKKIEELVMKETRHQSIPFMNDHVIYSYPVISKGQIIGVISACKMRQRAPFSGQDEFYILDTISHYLSSGFENIILRTELKDILEELNSAQERIIEQEKLRSLGEMTANIAHEIKNPLLVIGGFAKRLAKKLDLRPQERRYLNIILREVGRLEGILNDVLTYAKDIPFKRTVLNITDVISEIVNLFRSDPLWEKVDIEEDYERDIPPVYCDPEQMKQVFINILVNAYEAMEGEGKIGIRVFKKEIQAKTYVAVSIADTGGGIDPLIVDNIFNPFFTTKEKGTGLGLSISNKIVLGHKGKIEVQNRFGIGATFIIYLPAYEDSTSSSQNGKIREGGREER
jgi:signal transduction histidine kinase